jgi:hypothetical protein
MACRTAVKLRTGGHFHDLSEMSGTIADRFLLMDIGLNSVTTRADEGVVRENRNILGWSS